jgi:hypothetical protein
MNAHATEAIQTPSFGIAANMPRVGDGRGSVELAASRVPNASLQFTLGFLLLYVTCLLAGNAGFMSATEQRPTFPLADVAAIITTFLGIGTLWLARRPGVEPSLILNVFAAYEIAAALGVSLFENWGAGPESIYLRGVPLVALVIMVFPLVVSTTLMRQTLTALLAGAMYPLSIAVSHLLNGTTWPDGPTLIVANVSVGLAVMLACFPSTIVHDDSWRVQRSVLGNYRLLNRLARGGMGEIWRAEHVRLRRHAAVKFISPRPGQGAEMVPSDLERRFELEARVVSSLRSPHTVELYDFGFATDGTPFIVMELLEGMDLETFVDDFGPVTPARTIAILQHVCRSLAEAHTKGLVHRDLKPANIHISRDGIEPDFCKVLDFGLAHFHAARVPDPDHNGLSSTVVGTPSFMAPETIRGQGYVGPQADIYALGCTAFWLLTGRSPYEADSVKEMLTAHLHSEPRSLQALSPNPVPEELDAIVRSCMHKNPSQRPSSAEDLLERLDALRAENPWTRADSLRWWQTKTQVAATSIEPSRSAALAATIEV